MTDSFTSEDLEKLASQIQATSQERGEQRPPGPVLSVSLAQYFSYNIAKGGFAQLLYNLRGQYLAEIEQMLIDAPAPVAHSYYVKAIRECLAEKEVYKVFLKNDFVEPSSIKDSLHSISINYFNTNVEFLSEIQEFVLRSQRIVREWASDPLQGS